MKNKGQNSKCRGCGKKIPYTRWKYCRDCAILEDRFNNEHHPPKAKKSFWACLRKYGRRCRYSDVSLETDDYTSPWYLVFSLLNPQDKNRMVPAAAVFNEMKSALSRRLFRFYVLALHDHRQKHLKVKKRPVVHWRLLDPKGKGVCPCGLPIESKGHRYCARCSGIALRLKYLRLPRKTLNAIWAYVRRYGFVCYYTGMPLVLDDPDSPWYLVFDHWMPRDPRKVVLTSALVNEMKGDLTEEEFWYFIKQLANFFRYGTPVRKRKLKFWCRPYRSPRAGNRRRMRNTMF